MKFLLLLLVLNFNVFGADASDESGTKSPVAVNQILEEDFNDSFKKFEKTTEKIFEKYYEDNEDQTLCSGCFECFYEIFINCCFSRKVAISSDEE
jgi:hypothetical protein